MQSAGVILLLAAAVIVLFGGAGLRISTAAPTLAPLVVPSSDGPGWR